MVNVSKMYPKKLVYAENGRIIVKSIPDMGGNGLSKLNI